MKTLRAESGGKTRLVGMWRHPENGAFADLYAVARNARNHVEGLQIAAMNILGDSRRSKLAMDEDIRSAAKERLQLLGQLQRDFEIYKGKVKDRADRLTAVKPYRDNDPIAVQIDLALAAQLRAMEPSQRNAILLAGTDRAYMDAVLRLPRELSGVSSAGMPASQRKPSRAPTLARRRRSPTSPRRQMMPRTPCGQLSA